MPNLLREQLESYNRSAWELDHRAAMKCRDLEDWLDFGLALLDAVRRIDQRFRERTGSGKTPFRKEDAEDIHRLYEIWYSPCERLLRRIEEFEAAGFGVENAERFRQACSSSPIPGLEPEKLASAARQFERGPGQPLGKVMDAIRGRTGG